MDWTRSGGDAVILGASKADHLRENLDAVQAGPLPETLREAFRVTWTFCLADSPEYFTFYSGTKK